MKVFQFRERAKKIRIRIREVLSEPYKSVLGYYLSLGLKLNQFDFPTGEWPPPTPARGYINDFLSVYEGEVGGRCVEFAPPIYREKIGKSTSVTSYDIWDIRPGMDVTIVADLQNASEIPDDSFDTIICTHVLCCIPRPWLAVAEIHRLLSPGGLVLCTNPAILQKYAPHPRDYWRFTRDSMEMLFSGFSRVKLHSYGNAVTVVASPFFLMSYHLPRRILQMHDEYCPSIIAVAAWK